MPRPLLPPQLASAGSRVSKATHSRVPPSLALLLRLFLFDTQRERCLQESFGTRQRIKQKMGHCKIREVSDSVMRVAVMGKNPPAREALAGSRESPSHTAPLWYPPPKQQGNRTTAGG